MHITVKVGGPLRKLVAGLVAGELSLELARGARVSDALLALDLGGDKVRVLMLNGRAIHADVELNEGDRLGLFPRELAYNMYVATNFFNPLARKDIEDKKG